MESYSRREAFTSQSSSSLQPDSSWISVLLLLSAGSFGVFLLIHFYGFWDLSEENVIGDPHQYFLTYLMGTLGLLALALGCERALLFRRWINQLDDINAGLKKTSMALLERTSWTWFIDGNSEANKAGELLIASAEHHIRAFSIERTSRSSIPFEAAVIEALKSKKDTGLKFTSIYPVDLENSDEEKVSAVMASALERQSLHKHHDIHRRTRLKFLDEAASIGFGIILIDDKHAAIGISTTPEVELELEKANLLKRALNFGRTDRNNYHAVILLRNQKEAVAHLVEWFENSMEDAKSLEELEKQIGDKVSQKTRRAIKRSMFLRFLWHLVTMLPFRLFRNFSFQLLIIALFIVEALIGIFFSLSIGVIIPAMKIGLGEINGISYEHMVAVVLLTALMLTIGLERMISFPGWSRRLNKIQDRLGRYSDEVLRQLSDFRFISGSSEIMQKATGLVGGAARHIRILCLGLDIAQRERLTKEVLRRLSIDNPPDVHLTCVVASPEEGASAPAHGPREQHFPFSVRWVQQKSRMFLDVMIVDDKHALICIRDVGAWRYRGALSFTDQPSLVRFLKDWFDTRVREKSKPVLSSQVVQMLEDMSDEERVALAQESGGQRFLTSEK